VAERTVRLHPLAADEAEAARAWYFVRNPTVAGAFLLELDAAIATIAEAPKRWPRMQGPFVGICYTGFHSASSTLKDMTSSRSLRWHTIDAVPGIGLDDE